MMQEQIVCPLTPCSILGIMEEEGKHERDIVLFVRAYMYRVFL